MTHLSNLLLFGVMAVAFAACSKDPTPPPNPASLDLHALEDHQRAVVIEKSHGLSEEHYVIGDEIIVLHRRKRSSIQKDQLTLLKKISIDEYLINIKIKNYSHSAFVEEIGNAVAILKVAARYPDIIKICNRGVSMLRYHPDQAKMCAEAMASGGLSCEAILFHHKIKNPLDESWTIDEILRQAGKTVADCGQERINNLRTQLQDGASESELEELYNIMASLGVTMPGEIVNLCKDYIQIIPPHRSMYCGNLMLITGLECESLPFFERAGDLAKMKMFAEKFQCTK